MEIKDKIYFSNLINYKPKGVKKILYKEIQDDIYSLASKIRNCAKDALSEEILLKDARKEISDLLNNIRELKKEEK
ncbi:MAG TPA: hypothetical protein PK357_03200 [Candidatus Pacearchaeota archaeon]|nr:hypothetical protein [Candidatus Pacearchaeota archaeon]